MYARLDQKKSVRFVPVCSGLEPSGQGIKRPACTGVSKTPDGRTYPGRCPGRSGFAQGKDGLDGRKILLVLGAGL
jgi:hypothetical protein